MDKNNKIRALACGFCDSPVALHEARKHECFRDYDTVVEQNGKLRGEFLHNLIAGTSGTKSNKKMLNPCLSASTSSQVTLQESGIPDPIENLIIEVREREVIWKITDKNLVRYRTKANLEKEWTEVYKAVADHYTSVEAVKQKWKELSEKYKDLLKEYKIKNKGKSGQAADSSSGITWKYFTILSFLTDVDISYNNMTDDSFGKNQNIITVDSSEDQDTDIKEPERIEKRNVKKRKNDSIIETLASALAAPPSIQIPSITFAPPPPPPLQTPTSPLSSRGRKIDAIKAFIIFAEEKLRLLPAQDSEQLMLKMHQLFLSPQ